MTGMDREAWLESRKRGLGGSDVAALFGVHPWMSPLTLYLDKIGELPDRPGTAAMAVGHELEPLTRRMYSEDTGRTVVDPQKRTQHPEHAFMLANTDGTVIACDDHDGDGVFEGKTTNPYSREKWRDGPPLYVQLQATHYMVVTGLRWSSIAVLVLGTKDPLKWCDIELDTEFAEMMIEAERKFWTEHVEARIPPEADGHPATTEALRVLHPQDSGLMVDMPPEAADWGRELADVKKTIAKLKKQEEIYKNRICQAIGDATYGILPDGSGWVYRTTDRKGYTVKPGKQRKLLTTSAKAMGAHKKAAKEVLKRLS